MSVCFTLLFGLTIEFIMYYYLGDFSLFSEGRAMGTITGAMVNLLIAMGIRQVICRRRVMETQNYYFMILVLAGNIVWIYALESVSGENSPKTVLSLAIMIVVDLGMFYLYDRLGEAYQDKMQQRLLKEHMMVYQEQMHIMQQDQKKLDSLRHDMKNHMYLLQTYLNEGRYDKAQEYVNKMSEHLQTEHKYLNTENLKLDMTAEDLRKTISINNPTDTRILEITVNNADSALAKEIVDEVANVSSSFIGDKMEVVPPKIIEVGKIATIRTSPSVKKNAEIGFLLGFVACAAIVVVLTIMDDTIKTEEDIEKYLGISVLAKVPDRKDFVNVKSKKNKKKSHR